MIKFTDVSFSYDRNEPLLEKADFEIDPGLTLLLGPNGCGKSTIMKLAAGVEIPDKGRVSVGNFDLWKQEVEARKNISYLPEYPDLTPYASVREILNLVCRLRGEHLDRGKDALDFFGLSAVSHKNVRELSWGQRRRAVFAACLIGEPGCLLLDEPLEGLDIGAQKEILAWIGCRIEDGVSAVVVSHNIQPFLDGATSALTVKDGLIRFYKDLPSDAERRIVLFEKLAQGTVPS